MPSTQAKQLRHKGEQVQLDRSKLQALNWCGFDAYHDYMPGQAWMRDLLGENKPMVRVNNWLVLHELVRGGVGVTVLPCCFGDADPMLVRLTEVLPDVTADQFLLVHRDLRTLPRIRAIIDALVRLFQEQRLMLEGDRGLLSSLVVIRLIRCPDSPNPIREVGLASLRSSYLPAMAKVALIGCQGCETDCRKHAEKHAPCKACAEACAACAAECKKIGA